MKPQKGAALVVVISLLSISLMVGLSSMQSSHVNERLAGNFRAQSQAQMAAEFGAAKAVDELNLYVKNGFKLSDLPECDVSAESIAGGNIKDDVNAVLYELYACRKGAASGLYDIESKGNVFSGGDVIATRSVMMRAFDAGAAFLGLSPITVPSGIDSFDPPSSQVEFVGEEIVDGVHNPAIAVANESDKISVDSAIARRKDNYKGGVEAGMSESILKEENIADFVEFIGKLESCSKNQSGSGCEGGDSRFFTSSSGVDFGSKGSEKLTFYSGDLSAGGNFSGAGVLVVDGNVSFSGTPNYSGLIIVLGDYTVGGGGSSKGQGGFEGSIVTAPYSTNAAGELYYEDTSISISGGGSANYVYSVDALAAAFGVIGNAASYWNDRNSSSRKTGELLPDYEGWQDL
jgi:hypothetical protein